MKAQGTTRIRPTGTGGATSTATRPAASSARAAAPAGARTVARANAARARFATNTMSIADEMHYVKADIRKLVVLTAICLAVLIVLSFIVPSIVK